MRSQIEPLLREGLSRGDSLPKIANGVILGKYTNLFGKFAENFKI